MNETSRNPFVTILQDDQFLRLAQIQGGRVFGFPHDPAAGSRLQQQSGSLDEQLHGLGLLDGGQVAPRIAEALKPFLSPRQAMVVVRDLPGTGKQTLVFLFAEGRCGMQTRPEAGQVRLAEITPLEIEQLLAEWFPTSGDGLQDGLILEQTVLDEVIGLVETGHQEDALARMTGVEANLRGILINSIRERAWSASVARLELEGEQVRDAESFSAWQGAGTLWLAIGTEQPGGIALQRGTAHFHGRMLAILRHFVRREQVIRSFRLREVELAFAFSVINRSDLATQLLSGSQYDPQTWQTAQVSLLQKGLVLVNASGFPELEEDFQAGLLALALPEGLLEMETLLPGQTQRGSIYLGKRGTFCAHYVRDGWQVLECGARAGLVDYLGQVFNTFGGAANHKVPAGDITLSGLMTSLEKAGQPAESRTALIAAGLPEDIASEVSRDLAQTVYRARLRLAEGQRRHQVLLLKSAGRDWLFDFPGTDPETRGQVRGVERKNFLDLLNSMIR